MFNPFDYISVETVVLLASVVFLIRFYIHKRWQVLKNLGIPHDPPTIKGLGNLGDFMKDPDFIFKGDIINKEKFGNIYGSYNFFNPQITIGDPEILKQIYIKEFPTFSERTSNFKKINGKELNTGLNVVAGEQWKRIRNTLSPTFSSSKLKEMIGIIEQCADAMIKRLRSHVKENDGQFETKETFGRLSLDVVCSAAFSTNVHSQENENGKPPKVIQMAQKMFDISIAGSPWFLLLIMFPWIENVFYFFKFNIFPVDCINYYSGLVDALIKNRNKQGKHRTDLMQLMLQAQISEKDAADGALKGLTQNEIVGNSMIMILAGYETTANTMTFLAYNLAVYKEAQKKLQEEIDSAIEKYGGLTYEAVNSMKYLTMCLNESLRLYIPLPRNSRVCKEDITIKGIHIPKGMLVVVPVYGLSHDDEYWDEPFVYKPERMEDMSKIDPLVFQPFGAGPRNCVAMRLALMEVKMTFCKLLSEFDLDVCTDTPNPPLEMAFKASMRPKETINLRVIPREKK